MKALVLLALPATAAGIAAADSPTGAPEGWTTPMMDQAVFTMVSLDRLEYGDGDHDNRVLWDAHAWVGGDYHKLRFETEGEGTPGDSVDQAEVQILYERTLSPFWNLNAGLRYDARTGAEDVAHAAIGVHGLAPQWLETEVAAFVSEDGDLSLRAEAVYDLPLTQRLVLQPRLEIEASVGDVPELAIGSGVTSTELGIRLRYEIRRELAPYVGVSWERLHGGTRDLARAAGEHTSETWLVAGITAWF